MSTQHTEEDLAQQDPTVARAQARFVRIAPMKVRRVVDLVRGKSVADATATLQFAPQTASEPVLKVLQSAVANARHRADETAQAFDERALVIRAIFVDEGPTMKRFRPRAQGRASQILKRSSHITVVVGEPANRIQGGAR